MEATTLEALERGGICDITTIGARSGKPHRIEMGFHNLDGELFISGQRGYKRDWLANMKANPEFTLHLKRGVNADLPARAAEVTDPEERATILRRILIEKWGSDPERVEKALHRWVEQAPLVRFTVGG